MTRRYRLKSFSKDYQAGLEAIFAMGIATGIGIWVDLRYGRAPLFSLLGMALGFAACIVRLLRHQKERERIAKEGSGDTSDQAD